MIPRAPAPEPDPREKRDLTTRPNETEIVNQAQQEAGLTLSPEWQQLLQALIQGVIAAFMRKYGM